MGMLLANGSWHPVAALLLLCAASACLYSAGMVWNDWHDVERDRVERPYRPLASGAISLVAARNVGILLIVGGILFPVLACLSLPVTNGGWVALRMLLVTIALITAILHYDLVFKGTWFAPILMGLCRFLNVLLGSSAGPIVESGLFGFSPAVWAVAGSIGIFVAGITWLACNEAGTSRRGQLVFGALVMMIGLFGLVFMIYWPAVGDSLPMKRQSYFFPLLISAISLPIVRRGLIAIATTNPADVQATVIAALRSLIVFDASICVLASPGDLRYSIVVLGLLPLGLLLSRYSRHT
jgi:4-hydroxybenzoate polyprenyltransferase